MRSCCLRQDWGVLGVYARACSSKAPIVIGNAGDARRSLFHLRAPALSARSVVLRNVWLRLPGLLRLHAGKLHHFGPLRVLFGDECTERGGRACKRFATYVGKRPRSLLTVR
jgi:hypothetical protein